jgi:hypothetical protein
VKLEVSFQASWNRERVQPKGRIYFSTSTDEYEHTWVPS